MSKNWNGLLKIEEIAILSCDGKIKWKENNLKNIFHDEGQKFMLECCFVNSFKSETERILPPNNYYFGMDNRETLAAGDTISSIDGEPNKSTGYRRFGVKPDAFTLAKVSGVWQAKSPVVSFKATGASGFGPVKNVFLTASKQQLNEVSELVTTNYLISSVATSSVVTLATGESFRIKMSLSLKDINL